MMIVLADESVDIPVIARLRADGHTVVAVRELAPGIDDPNVLALANEQAAVLLTMDKDFGDLTVRDQLPVAGVILIRLPGLMAKGRAIRVSQALGTILDQAAGA